MRVNIEVTGSIIQSIDAEKAKMEKATARALNKTALWVRSETVKQVSDEKQIPKKTMRKNLSVDKANRKRLWSIIKLSSQWIGVAKLVVLGSIKQTKIRAKAGALIATMKNVHIGIFRRRYTTSLPIDEIKINTHTRETVKELAKNEAERVF